MAAVVTVQNLRKRYRRRDPWAVDGVTFDLQPGQAFGLLGPNGAGKTSVVKMIAGLLRPDSGSITLFGTEPGNPVARKDLGFSPEDPDFPKFLRASEVLDYFASLLGLDGAERKRRIPETLAFAGLDTEHRQIRQYSKGMKQRLGIAQAILGRPKLLVLDEPTADLDPIGRRDVRALIERLKASGVAILLNSHLLSEAELVCDTVAILARGRVLKEGAMAEVVPEGSNLEEVFVQLVEADQPQRDTMPSFIIEAAGIALLGIGLKLLYQVLSSNPNSLGTSNPAAFTSFLELLFVSYLF